MFETVQKVLLGKIILYHSVFDLLLLAYSYVNIEFSSISDMKAEKVP